MTNYLKNLASARLTRKEFLLYLGAIFVGIIGIPSILKVVGNVGPSKVVKTVSGPRPFGAGPYGA